MYRKLIDAADKKIELLNTRLDKMEENKNIDFDSFNEQQQHSFLMGQLHGYEEMRQLLFTNQINEDSKLVELTEVLVRMLWQVSLGGSSRQMKLFDEMQNVSVGDLVMETSIGDNVMSMDKIGYLRRIEKEEDGWKHYYVECLNGKVIDWTNCSFIKIPTAYFNLKDY